MQMFFNKVSESAHGICVRSEKKFHHKVLIGTDVDYVNLLSGSIYEPCHEKPTFCLCENKDADRGNREADQRICFRYIDSTIPILSKSEITSL